MAIKKGLVLIRKLDGAKAMNSTTIMIIDNRPPFRALIRKALPQGSNPDVKIIECETDEHGDNAVAQIAANAPSVVLLNIGYRILEELRLGKKIARTFPQIRLIILSTNPKDDDDEMFEVVKSGAKAYIRNTHASVTQLITTIEQVNSGGYPICDNIARRPKVALLILKHFQNGGAKGRASRANYITLTEREIQALRLIAEGNQTEHIDNILGISEQAIKNQLREVLGKLVENETVKDSFAEIQNSLMRYRIARDGNLFIFGAPSSPSCRTLLLLNDPPHA